MDLMEEPEFLKQPQGTVTELFCPIPYYSQFSSPELVLDIIRGRISAEDDPRWKEFGAPSKEQYTYWSWRACGIAALKMAVEALGGPTITMMDWIEDGLAIDGFIFKEKSAATEATGWLHKALAELARCGGLKAECHAKVHSENVAKLIGRGKLVIASVSHELGEPGEITMDRGHLVLIHGYSSLEGKVEALLINNPSGRYPEFRENCWIPGDRFAKAFSGRIISIYC